MKLWFMDITGINGVMELMTSREPVVFLEHAALIPFVP